MAEIDDLEHATGDVEGLRVLGAALDQLAPLRSPLSAHRQAASKLLDGLGLIELLPWSTSNKPVIGGKEKGTVSNMCQLPIPVVVACEQEASKDQDV